MTENINILLSDLTTEEEKINAANNIITNYNLDFTTEEILPVFTKSRLEINCPNYYYRFIARYEFLFEFLLNQNIDMFIAIVKYYSYKEKTKTKSSGTLLGFVNESKPFYVGSNPLFSYHLTIIGYKNLLDYNNFNIDNLTLPNECKEQIQEYRDEKYGGRLTKSAKK